MNISIIEPKSPDINFYSNWLRYLPLLGPVYIGTLLKDRHDVKIYNENITELLYNEIIDSNVILISIMTPTAPRGYDIAKIIGGKKHIVFGGSHATFMPEEALRFGNVVKGECEGNIVDLIENLNSNRQIYEGEPIKNLDDLPIPDLSLIEGYNSKVKPILTSRGCSYNCNFCTVHKMFGRKYRIRSEESVIEELRDSKDVFFYDDEFLINRKRSESLLESMIKKGIRPGWTAQVRADDIKDESFVRLLKKSNCFALCFGFEYLTQENLDACNKKLKLDDIYRAIELAKKYDIIVHGMFMFEGEMDYNKTGIDSLQLSIPTPLPGSDLFEETKGNLIVNPFEDYHYWRYFDGQHVVSPYKNLSPKEVQEQTIKSLKEFYSFQKIIKTFFEDMGRDNFKRTGLRLLGNSLIRKWKKNNIKYLENLMN